MCAACTTQLPKASFDAWIQSHAKQDDRKLVCKSCQENGYSPQDVIHYVCCKGHRAGHKSFKSSDLHNAKRPGRSATGLICTNCRQRQDALVKKLNMKGAWKCTCKDAKALKGKRAFMALHAHHDRRCNLAPIAAGESRWDGKNVGVTLEDVQFLERGAHSY